MRIVWKDTAARTPEYKPIKYRGFMAYGTPKGWEITVPGDNNLYASSFCAQNAIDQYFGDFGKHGTAKRINFGIKIVDKKDGETA